MYDSVNVGKIGVVPFRLKFSQLGFRQSMRPLGQSL